MSQLLRSAHFALAGLWLGCIVTEIIVERSLSGAGDEMRLRLAQLHWRMAALVEAPALLGVLVTGGTLLGAPHGVGPGFQVMLTAGLLAIFVGVFKVWLASKRRSAALRGRWSAHQKLSDLQQLLGTLVLLGVLTAIIAGALSRSTV